MASISDNGVGMLFHGWVELLTLLLMYLAALVIIGWCWNRGFRPADRGPLVPLQLLVVGYGLILLLHHFDGERWPSLIIGGAVVLSGFIGRGTHPRGLWTPIILMASLIGLGLNLSALVLLLVIALALLFSARQGR